MLAIHTVDDVYPAVDELLSLLMSTHVQLARTLDHRIHKVAWTTRSELFEELQQIFLNTLDLDNGNLPPGIVNQIQQLLIVIQSYFVNRANES